MFEEATSLQFDLSTGNFYASQVYVDQVEAAHSPLNLVQLLAMGKLLVDATCELGQDDASSDLIVPLVEVLKNEQYEDMDTSGYDILEVGAWNMDDYVDYGRWLDGLTRGPQQVKTGLSREVIKRAYRLGIGPSVGRIGHKQRFGNTTRFYEACEVLPNRGLYRYDDWRPQQLADYAEGVFLNLKNQAESQGENRSGYQLKLNAEIERRAQLGLGPALWIYKRHEGGGVMKFMTMNGYVDPKSMEPEDYISLGVRFMCANGGKPPTPSALDFLARSRRAPTSHDVWTKFTWDEYLGQTRAAYEKQEAVRKQVILKQKLVVIKQELEDGTLPRYIIKGKPTMEIIASRARWRLVGELLPNLNPGHKQAITLNEGSPNFVGAIRNHSHGKLNVADIEETAMELNVYEDIWPQGMPGSNTNYMEYLRVPAELLGPGSSAYLAHVKHGSK